MGLVLLSIIVAMVIVGYIIVEFGYDIVVFLCGIPLGLLVGVLVFTVGLLPTFILQSEPIDPHKTEIYSIKDSSRVQGRFVLGSGTVKEDQYFYYVVEKNGFKSVDKAKVENSKMKEGDVEQPYVVTYEMQFKSAIARFFYGKYTGEKSYEFYLPENTITTEYKIDLE